MNPELLREIKQLKQKVEALERKQPEVGRWVDWSPTIFQGGTVTNTITYARYMIIQKLVLMQARIVITGSGTGANAVSINNVPAVIAPTQQGAVNYACGQGMVVDSGTAFYVGSLVALDPDTFQIVSHNETAAVGVDPNFALANNDIITFTAMYERV